MTGNFLVETVHEFEMWEHIGIIALQPNAWENARRYSVFQVDFVIYLLVTSVANTWKLGDKKQDSVVTDVGIGCVTWCKISDLRNLRSNSVYDIEGT